MPLVYKNILIYGHRDRDQLTYDTKAFAQK